MPTWPVLEEWDSWPDARKSDTALDITRRHSQKPVFEGLQEFSLASQRRNVALFRVSGASFVFVPGGSVSIGYDPRSFTPSPEQQESYRDSAKEYGLDEDVRAFLSTMVGAARRRTIPPMLVEREPQEIGLEPVSPDLPEIRKQLELMTRHRVPMAEVHRKLRVRREADGAIRAWRITPRTHGDLRRDLDVSGFRLPSSDEWEYLCGGGAKTLFRWGDSCPCDRYPTDTPARTKGLPDWSLHRVPNAFGLTIAWDPYKYEVVGEPNVLRGGDGGANVCGGAGYFLGWLPLASAFKDPSAASTEECSTLFLRRVMSLE